MPGGLIRGGGTSAWRNVGLEVEADSWVSRRHVRFKKANVASN